MNGAIKLAAVAVVATGTFAALPGCQNRGPRNDTDRAVPAAATFDRGYTAKRGTEWISSPNTTTPERGTIGSGEKVYFDQAPGTSDWQQARWGNRTVYVRPGDFEMSSR